MTAPLLRTADRTISAAILAAAFSSPTFAQTPPAALSPTPTFNVRFLPHGPGVTESRAGGAAGFGESGNFVVGGSIHAAGGWDPTLWARIDGPLSLPIRLGPPGQRGHVNAVANALTDDGDVVAVGRSKPTGLSSVTATAWHAKYDGIDGESNDAVRVLLPTPAGATSEAVDVIVTNFAGDGWGALIIGGRVTIGGVDRAALWTGPNSLGNFEIQMLHGTTGAAASSVSDLALSPTGELLVMGNAIGTDGTTLPARWVIDGTSNTIMFSTLDVPNHVGTAITSDWNGDGIDTIALRGAGAAANSTAPQLARVTADGDTNLHALTLPPGQTGGTANGIIAILIGLLVPGHTVGPAGQSASIWVNQAEMPDSVIDLNLAARYVPLGVQLTDVQAVEPPVEEVSFVFHNITWFGASRNAAGRERGFIATTERQADSVDQLGQRD
ncbi:MAG: hypothetical protein ACKVS9_15600 [Phycisphaerae bacterium]